MEVGAFAVSGGDARCGTHRAAAAAAAAVMTRETEQTVGVWTGGGELSPADGGGAFYLYTITKVGSNLCQKKNFAHTCVPKSNFVFSYMLFRPFFFFCANGR